MAKVLEYLFSAGSGQWVANAAGSGANPTGNLLGTGERFSLAKTASGAAISNFTLTTVALTDEFVDGPVAGSKMTRVVSSSGTASLTLNVPLTQVPYTLSLYALSNGVADTFRIGNVTDTQLTDCVATTTIQRFTATFTPGSAATKTIAIVSSDGLGTAFDISIWGARLDLGASALAYNLASGDLFLGLTGAVESADPTWASDGLSIDGSNDCAGGVLGAALTFSTMTVYAAVKQTAASTYSPILTEDYNGSLFIFGGDNNINQVGFKFRTGQAQSNFCSVPDSTVHLVAGSYDGTNVDIFLDGILVGRTVAAGLSAIDVKRLVLARFNTVTTFTGRFYYLAAYNTSHDLPTRAATISGIRDALAARSVALTTPAAFLLSEGDSISAFSTTTYLSVMRPNVTPFVHGWMRGVAGSTVSTLTTRAAVTDAAFATVPTGTRRILTVLIGANDLEGVSAVAFVASLKVYCLARKAATANLKIILVPITPRTEASSSGFNTKRNAANALVAADTSFWDRIVVQDASMWADAAASDTNKYSDGLHPTAAGHVLIEPFVRTEVQAILNGPAPSTGPFQQFSGVRRGIRQLL